jgi:hypothetical protein
MYLSTKSKEQNSEYFSTYNLTKHIFVMQLANCSKIPSYNKSLLFIFQNLKFQIPKDRTCGQGNFQALFYYRYTVVNTQSSIEF